MLPSPSKDEINSPEFEAIFQLIKKWDIQVPEQDIKGYSSGNGSHVKMILDVLKPVNRNKKIDFILNI